MLPVRDSYDDLVSDFAWQVPPRFNIAKSVCDDWAAREPERVCLMHYLPDRDPDRLTYGALRRASDALANGLSAQGIGRGDRVALLLPQGFEAAIAHIAIYKMGAIAVPLALLFGVDALDYRLRSSGAKCVISNAAGAAKVSEIADKLDQLALVVSTEKAPGTTAFDALVDEHDHRFETTDTAADDPALMIFTSGTTGPPKGAVHAHRVLLGHLPGIQLSHEFLPQPDDLFWTPADWAWAGGLLNVLLPGLYFGVPVVSSAAQKFDPETAFRIMADTGVRNAFIPPTALKMLRTVDRPAERFSLKLRTIGSGGESLGKETYEWAKRELGITINEFYGQTECNLVVSSCNRIGVTRAGAIGLAVPGHTVAIIDGSGKEVPAGTPGQIAVRRPDPVMFLHYWNNEAASRAKFIGDWMVTGDQGIRHADGCAPRRCEEEVLMT